VPLLPPLADAKRNRRSVNATEKPGNSSRNGLMADFVNDFHLQKHSDHVVEGHRNKFILALGIVRIKINLKKYDKDLFIFWNNIYNLNISTALWCCHFVGHWHLGWLSALEEAACRAQLFPPQQHQQH
jgi:hypothetical protein